MSTLRIPLDEAALLRIACGQDVPAPLTVPSLALPGPSSRATDSPVSAAPTPALICNALHEAPMSPRIYVGGLPSSATDTRLRLLCAPHGTVKSAA